MEPARYEGINNQVTAIDLDVIPCGFDLGSYLRMFQSQVGSLRYRSFLVNFRGFERA